MPRKRVVTPDAVKETIESVDRPFATTGDVAETLDVTKQAVRNHTEELGESEELESGQVGKRRVFWLAERQTPEQVVSTPATPRQPENDSTDSEESLFDRLFTLPSFGDPPEAWLLASTIGMFGLVMGVAFGIAVTHPALGVALTAVFGLLLLGGFMYLTWAVYYLFNRQETATTVGESA